MKPALPVLALLPVALAAADLPRVEVTRDNTVLHESCEVVVPGVIPDADGNGVIHVAADDIVIRFAGALHGAPPETPWSDLDGIGIRIENRRNVRLEGARIHGYRNAVLATGADGLVIDGGDFSDNFRQRLRSTREREDGADWMFPHHNDTRKWRDQYGGAVCIEDSRDVTIRRIRVRRSQNGIILDRVTDSRVYDNDCSFLSGWGIALWRSSRNVISRNAFDFCVRGHVEGVYNRGQDSAGILCFEQCNENMFVENSATHGGDGFFGFAGREALGELWLESERERLRRESGRDDVADLLRVPDEIARRFSALGCNSNILVGNDFSYASAHGVEMTFSEGNVLAMNRLVENAICGFWGGYSSGTLILSNQFVGNGAMAYGLERGGINMEHAAGNWIHGNEFINNKCAIHLWWDPDTGLRRLPGVSGNDRGVSGNLILSNRFAITPDHPFRNLRPDDRLVVLQLRDDGDGNVRSNRYAGNMVDLRLPNAVEFAIEPGAEPLTDAPSGHVVPRLPEYRVFGETRPVGARPHLRGREHIFIDEWGPREPE